MTPPSTGLICNRIYAQMLATLPPYEGRGRSFFCDCDNGHSMRLILGSSETELKAYCAQLLEAGFREIYRHSIGNNYFHTFQNDDLLMVHLYLVGHSGELRIITAEDPVLQTEDRVPPSKGATGYLRALRADGGMGYIVGLSDGSFLVIDGGYNTESCALKLYQVLKKNAPDPDHIVISCWIFTHGHRDHVGAFLGFVSQYLPEGCFEIRSFLHNICLTPEQSHYLADPCFAATVEMLRTQFPTVPAYYALTGQRFRFANAEVEILYTIEDYMPAAIVNESDAESEEDKKGNGNIQTVVFRLTVNDSRLFFMGDTATVCCNEMCDRYGALMKSDYVQMSHHGIGDERPRARNATKEIYSLISPRYGLLPCKESQLPQKLLIPVNQYLAELVGGEENILCSGNHRENIPL